LSYSIFFTDYASERVTAKGNPSGIATTSTVTANINTLRKAITIAKEPSSVNAPFTFYLSHTVEIVSSNTRRIHTTITIAMAANRPNFPITPAIYSSLSCSGVFSSVFCFSTSDIFPSVEFLPTAKAIYIPVPFPILVPDITTGEGTLVVHFSLSRDTSFP